MSNFNNQQHTVYESNQEIIDIIYRHTPHPNLIICFWTILFIIFILSNFISYVTFYSVLDSNNIGESPLGLSLIAFFVTLIPFMLMAGMYFSDKQKAINDQIFDLKKLNKAIKEIKKQGLYSQFIQDSLFYPITNPSTPITYAIIDAIRKKQDKRMEKILANEIETKNKNITNQQKLCVDKYRNKLN